MLENLNYAQRQAVTLTDGHVLVLAGAGTGKTRVLTTRVAYILSEGLARPFQILAVTFTNKAAQEMKERILSIVGNLGEGLWIGTFHSLCVRILRRHIERLGYHSAFTILDTDDQLRLLKQILKAESIDEKRYPPKIALNTIGRWKDKGLLYTQVEASSANDRMYLKIYKLYQERLGILNALDFGDLLLLTLRLFKEHPDVLEMYQNQFRYLLVDEYQDTNVAQYMWLRLLAKESRNLCCVGDDDQSIYGWRGADVEHILRFEKDFENAVVIRLEENYRSTPAILGAASSLIACNEGRLGKTLKTAIDAKEQAIRPEDKVLILGYWSSEDEVRAIADDILSLTKEKYSYKDVAILVRAGFQTREFEDYFLRLAVSYRVVGGMRFYERQEVRDVVAYIRLMVQGDDGLAFERIINLPKRGIGATTIHKMNLIAREKGISLPKAAFIYAENEAKGQSKSVLLHFFSLLDAWRKRLSNGEPHGEVVRLMLEDSGYIDHWRQETSPDALTRLENLKELVQAIDEFTSLNEFLEHVSLVVDRNRQLHDNSVTLMTLHAAKGLEFPVVFLSGWEEGTFPHQRVLNESGNRGLEEERRLAYVGITRARHKLFITYALNRRNFQGGWDRFMLSRFVKDISPLYIEHIKPGQKRLSSLASIDKRTPFDCIDIGETVGISDVTTVRKSSGGFALKQRVKHNKFGSGFVKDIDGEHVGVEFDELGYKKIMGSFLKAM